MRRIIRRRHRNKYVAGGVIGMLGCFTSLTPLLEGHVSPWVFVLATVAAFALAGISQVMGDGD